MEISGKTICIFGNVTYQYYRNEIETFKWCCTTELYFFLRYGTKFDPEKFIKTKMGFIWIFSEEEGRNVPPNNTIMIRGLAQHITETDISDDIQSCGLVAKDIRLIRKKETGIASKLDEPS